MLLAKVSATVEEPSPKRSTTSWRSEMRLEILHHDVRGTRSQAVDQTLPEVGRACCNSCPFLIVKSK